MAKTQSAYQRARIEKMRIEARENKTKKEAGQLNAPGLSDYEKAYRKAERLGQTRGVPFVEMRTPEQKLSDDYRRALIEYVRDPAVYVPMGFSAAMRGQGKSGSAGKKEDVLKSGVNKYKENVVAKARDLQKARKSGAFDSEDFVGTTSQSGMSDSYITKLQQYLAENLSKVSSASGLDVKNARERLGQLDAEEESLRDEMTKRRAQMMDLYRKAPKYAGTGGKEYIKRALTLDATMNPAEVEWGTPTKEGVQGVPVNGNGMYEDYKARMQALREGKQNESAIIERSAASGVTGDELAYYDNAAKERESLLMEKQDLLDGRDLAVRSGDGTEEIDRQIAEVDARIKNEETIMQRYGEQNAQRNAAGKYKEQLGALTKEKERREKISAFDVKSADDFQGAKGYQNPKSLIEYMEMGTENPLQAMFGGNEIDRAYHYINNNGYGGAEVEDYFEQHGYDLLTDEEKETFNYYYNTGSKEQAKAYLGAIGKQLEERRAQSLEQYQTELGYEHPVLATGVSAIANAANALLTPAQYIAAKNGANENSSLFSLQRGTNAMRQGAGQNVYEAAVRTLGTEKAGEVAQFLYNTMNSAVDSAVSASIGAGLLGNGTRAAVAAAQLIQSSNSASNELASRLEEGMDPGKAMLYATLSGAIEAATEKWSVEELMGDPTDFGLYLLKNFASEASEEMTGDVLNTAADWVIATATNSETDLQKAAAAYEQQGYAPQEAMRKALADWGVETILDGLAGGISGVGSSAVYGGARKAQGAIAERAFTRFQDAERGNNVIQNKTVDNVLQVAKTLPENSKARAMAEKLQKSKGGKGLNNAYQLGKLVRAISEETNGQAGVLKDGMIDDVKQRLEEKGETGDVDAVAEAAVNMMLDAESVTDEQKKAITESDYGVEVLKEASEANAERVESVKKKQEDALTLEDAAEKQEETKARETKDAEAADENGNDLTVKDIAKVGEDAQVTVEVNGKEETRSLESVDFADKGETGTAYRMAAGMETKEKARAFLSVLEKTQMPLETARAAFNRIYDAGVRGMELSDSQSMEYKRLLGDEAAHAAYLAGTEAQAAQNARLNFDDDVNRTLRETIAAMPSETEENYAGVVYKGSRNTKLSGAMAAQVELLNEIGRRYNVQIVLEDTLGAENGHFDNDRQITIAMDAEGGLLTRTLSHELNHYIARWNSKGAQELQDFVLDKLRKTEGYNLDERVEEKQKQYKAKGIELTREQALEEITGDSLLNVFADESTIQDLMEQHETLGQKIVHFLKNIVSELKSMASRLKSPEARAMAARSAQELQELREKMIQHLNMAMALRETQMDAQESETAQTNTQENTAAEETRKEEEQKGEEQKEEKQEKEREERREKARKEVEKAKQTLEQAKKEMEEHEKKQKEKQKETDKKKREIEGQIKEKKQSLEQVKKQTEEALQDMKRMQDIEKSEKVSNAKERAEEARKAALESERRMREISETLENTYENLPQRYRKGQKVADGLAMRLRQMEEESLLRRLDRELDAQEKSEMEKRLKAAQWDINRLKKMGAEVSDQMAKLKDAKAVQEKMRKVMHDLNEMGQRIKSIDGSIVEKDDLAKTGWMLEEEMEGLQGQLETRQEEARKAQEEFERAQKETEELKKRYPGGMMEHVQNLQNEQRTLERELSRLEIEKKQNALEYDETGERLQNEVREAERAVEEAEGREKAETEERKFSLKEVDEINPEMQRALQENVELQNVVRRLQKEMKKSRSPAMSERTIRNMAKEMINEYGSRVKLKTLTENLTKAFDAMSTAETTQESEIAMQAMADIAQDMIEKSGEIDRENYDEYKELRERFKKGRIGLTETQWQEAKSLYGSAKDFRRAMFGKWNPPGQTVTNAPTLDMAWTELAQQYPQWFDVDASEGDMVHQVINMLEETKIKYIPLEDADIGQTAAGLALDIFDRYMDIPTEKSITLDTMDAMNALNKNQAEIITGLRKELRAAKRQMEAESKRLAEARRRIVSQRQRTLEQNENRKKKDIQQQILRTKTNLEKKLLAPKSGQFVPYPMRDSAEKLLQMIDFANTKNLAPLNSALLERAKAAYEALGAMPKAGEAEDYAVERVRDFYNEDLIEHFDELGKTATGKRSWELDMTELQHLKAIIKGYEAIVINADKMFMNDRRESLSETGDGLIIKMNMRKEHKTQGKIGRVLTDSLGKGLLKATSVFHKFEGTEMFDAWRSLRNAEGKHVRNVQEAAEYLDGMLDKYDMHKSINMAEKEAQKTAKTFKLENGSEVRLTKQQIMTLYATYKREQLVGTQHLLKGGFTLQNEGKGKSFRPYNVTKEDLNAITKTLTKTETAYVDEMVHFLSSVCAEWGNEVTRKMYGVEKFVEDYYIPFSVNTNYLASDPAQAQDQRLKMGSFTKALTRKASNALVIHPFTQLWCEHAEKMSDYNAFVLPIEDMTRLMNYRTEGESVKSSMNAGYGKQTTDYIISFLRNLNGNARQTGGDKWLKQLSGRAKGAAVTFNLSVALQQAGAGIRAAAEINPKYIAIGMAKGLNVKKSYDEAKKYAPIAVLKSWGYFDTQQARGLYERARSTAMGKLSEVGGFMAEKGDQLNWAQIWEACKAEQRAEDKGMSHEELMEKTAQRFQDVIDKTQVVDSIFQRAEWAFEPGRMRDSFLNFMSEPITQYNMLYRSIWDISEAYRNGRWKDDEAVKKAVGGFARNVAAVAMSGALTAGLKTIITAMRDRDDEKEVEDENGETRKERRTYWDKYLEAYGGNFLDSFAGLVPIYSDMIQNTLGLGNNYGGNDDLEMQGVSYAGKATQQLQKVLSGQDDDYGKVLWYLSQAVSYTTGVGFASAFRDLNAITQTMLNAADQEFVFLADGKVAEVRDLPTVAWDKNKDFDKRLEVAKQYYAYSKKNAAARGIDTKGMKQAPDVYKVMMLDAYYTGGFGKDFEKAAQAAIDRGATADTLNTAFKNMLIDQEQLVEDAVNALMRGDTAAYQESMAKMEEKGIGASAADSMVKSAYKSANKEPEEPKEPGTGEELVERMTEGIKEGTQTAGNVAAKAAYTKAKEAQDAKALGNAVQALRASGTAENTLRTTVVRDFRSAYLEALWSGDTKQAQSAAAMMKGAGVAISESDLKEWSTGSYARSKFYESVDAGDIDKARKIRQYIFKKGDAKETKKYIDKNLKEKYKKMAGKERKEFEKALLRLGYAKSTIDGWAK